jgi:hypothetical protein
MGSICSGFMFRRRPNGTLGGFYGRVTSGSRAGWLKAM